MTKGMTTIKSKTINLEIEINYIVKLTELIRFTAHKYQ